MERQIQEIKRFHKTTKKKLLNEILVTSSNFCISGQQEQLLCMGVGTYNVEVVIQSVLDNHQPLTWKRIAFPNLESKKLFQLQIEEFLISVEVKSCNNLHSGET